MREITFDTGVREYRVNGVPLRFNPADPGFVMRADEVYHTLEDMQKEAEAAAASTPQPQTLTETVKPIAEAAEVIREKLLYLFGKDSNIDAMFQGASAAAFGSNGVLAVINFLNAVLPEIQADMESVAKNKADAATFRAKANRAQRRAQK